MNQLHIEKDRRVEIEVRHDDGDMRWVLAIPIRIWYGVHPKYQGEHWFLEVTDLDLGQERNYRLVDVFAMRPGRSAQNWMDEFAGPSR